MIPPYADPAHATGFLPLLTRVMHGVGAAVCIGAGVVGVFAVALFARRFEVDPPQAAAILIAACLPLTMLLLISIHMFTVAFRRRAMPALALPVSDRDGEGEQ